MWFRGWRSSVSCCSFPRSVWNWNCKENLEEASGTNSCTTRAIDYWIQPECLNEEAKRFADDVVMRSVTTCFFFSYCLYTKATGMQLMATTRFCSSRWWSSSGKGFNLCAHFFVFVQRYICCLFTTLWVDLQLPLTRSLQYRVKEILFSDSASPCCAYVIQLINVSWVERHRDGNDCVCLQLKWVIIWNVLESACRPECRSCCCEFYAWRLLLP